MWFPVLRFLLLSIFLFFRQTWVSARLVYFLCLPVLRLDVLVLLVWLRRRRGILLSGVFLSLVLRIFRSLSLQVFKYICTVPYTICRILYFVLYTIRCVLYTVYLLCTIHHYCVVVVYLYTLCLSMCIVLCVCICRCSRWFCQLFLLLVVSL